jgi:hypothetical protein
MCADAIIVMKLQAYDAVRAIVHCRSITPVYDIACTSAHCQGVTEVYGVIFVGVAHQGKLGTRAQKVHRLRHLTIRRHE